MGRSSEEGLLGPAEVAEALGVAEATVWRWCREGRLPCLKVGRAWRLRRGSLEDFLRESERPRTLLGQLGNFLRVSENVLAVGRDRELLHRLDAAFFGVGERRGALLVRFTGGGAGASGGETRAALGRHGLDVGRLEAQGRLRLGGERGPSGGREDALRRLLAERDGGAVWASFDWTEGPDLGEVLAQQEALSALVEGRPLVVKTAVLEKVADGWPPPSRRRADAAHSGTIRLTQTDLSFGRVRPLPRS